MLHSMVHTMQPVSTQRLKRVLVQELSIAGDDLLTWRLKLWHFDEDCAGGRNLNKDLEQLNKR